jgi:hypothetical protein
VIFLGYEMLILVVGFAGSVFGSLQSRWVARAADAIDRRVLWRTSTFEQDYREAVVSRHRFVDLKGLATRGEFAPALAEVFVDVSLAPQPAHLTPRQALAGGSGGPGGGSPVRQSIWDFLGGPRGPRGMALAVIGAPGTGKTTLLKHLALQLAQGGAGPRDLPVLLFLRDHAAAIAEGATPGAGGAGGGFSLPDAIRASLRQLAAEEPPGWLERQLRDGRCVVLLDGLDEVAREDQRRAVARWVEEQVEHYEANDFVLTSRPHGYLTAPLNRAKVLQVRRFTGKQIAHFVHGWCRAIERLSTGVRATDAAGDAGACERAAEEAEDLLKRLRDRPALYELATNPLLLTMIANVHRYRGALPGSRAELFREICEVLLWRRQQAKNPADTEADATGAKWETVMRALAYQMMTDRLRDFDAGQAEAVLPPTLARVGLHTPVAAFLESVTRCGLLVEREHGVYAFAHLTLQEHLAAAHILHHRLTEMLAANVDDDWWRETTLLYAARSDPAPIVEACLASRTTTALALAFDCADAATEFAPDTARRLERLRLESLTEAASPERRRLMTAVTVMRQLQQTVRLGDDTLVCVRPVTMDIYWLFAADRPWAAAPRLGSCGACGRALGITRQAALAFVEWLNAMLPDGPEWRLPTRSDLADSAFEVIDHATHHAVWYLPAVLGVPGEEALPELWVPEGSPHPWSARLGPVTDGWGATETPETTGTTGGDGKTVLAVGQLGLISLAYDALDRRLGRNLNLADRLAHALTRDLTNARRLRLRLPDGHAAHAGGGNAGNLLAGDYARELARDLARAHDLTPARDLGRAASLLDLTSISRLDADLDRALAHARALADALAHAPETEDMHRLSESVSNARELVRQLGHAASLARDLARAYDLVPALTDPALAERLYHELSRAHADSDLYRESNVALTINLALDHELDFAPARHLVHARTRVAALTLASLSLLASREARSPRERRRLTASLRADWGECTVFPEDLTRAVEAATARMLNHAEPASGSAALRRIAYLLAQEVAALLGATEGGRGLGWTDAVYLELACRALAAVAEQNQGDLLLSELYRTAAAGIAVLRNRTDGTITPSEVLILVRS